MLPALPALLAPAGVAEAEIVMSSIERRLARGVPGLRRPGHRRRRPVGPRRRPRPGGSRVPDVVGLVVRGHGGRYVEHAPPHGAPPCASRRGPQVAADRSIGDRPQPARGGGRRPRPAAGRGDSPGTSGARPRCWPRGPWRAGCGPSSCGRRPGVWPVWRPCSRPVTRLCRHLSRPRARERRRRPRPAPVGGGARRGEQEAGRERPARARRPRPAARSPSSSATRLTGATAPGPRRPRRHLPPDDGRRGDSPGPHRGLAHPVAAGRGPAHPRPGGGRRRGGRRDAFSALPGLDEHLARPDVTDIFVNGCDDVRLRMVSGDELRVAPIASSDDELVALVPGPGPPRRAPRRRPRTPPRRGLSGGHQEKGFSPTNPILDLFLSDGSRLAAAAWVTEPARTCRSAGIPLVDCDQKDLVERWGMYDEGIASLLAAAVRARMSDPCRPAGRARARPR